MKKQKLIIIIALITTALIFTVGKTYASFQSKDFTDNIFMTGKVSHEIEEVFDPGEYKPKDDITKEVKLQNNSNVDTFMRVAIIPMWFDIDDKGNEIPWAGDTSNVTINYNLDNISDISLLNKDNFPEWYKTNAHKWVEDKTSPSNVHYFYYTDILGNGEITSQIIDSVNYKVPEGQESRYEGKKLKIKVKSEIVLAKEEALKNAWSNLQDDKIKEMLLSIPKGV